MRKNIHSPSRQGYPNVRTLDYWLDGDTSERFPQSRSISTRFLVCVIWFFLWCRTVANHNKASGFERRLEASLCDSTRCSISWSLLFSFTLWRTSNTPSIWTSKILKSDDEMDSSESSWTVMHTTPNLCKQKRFHRHIAYGGEIGKVKAGNTLRVRWCGRFVTMRIHLIFRREFKFSKFFSDEWLLAMHLLGNRRLFSSTETGLLCHFSWALSIHGGHSTQGKKDVCKRPDGSLFHDRHWNWDLG